MFTRVIDSKEENPTKHKELKSDIFNKIKSKKDFDDLKDKVLDFKFKIPNIQQYKNSDNAELVYEDSRFVIFRVLNFEGACEIASGTKWCHAKSKNSYDSYKDKTNYMFFDNSYPKNNSKSGFALSVDKYGNIIELKSKDQKYKGKEHIDYPISYLTDDLGLDLKLFKYIKPSVLSNINEFRDGLTVSIIKDKFSWLLAENVEIYEAVIGYEDDKLIWYRGDWYKGNWEDGIWKGGDFIRDGIWKDGTFESGYFAGKWYGGEWLENIRFFKGEWLDPRRRQPLGIIDYRDGLTMDVIKFYFPWLLEEDVVVYDAELGYDNSTKKLIWYFGSWEKGTWKDGIWKMGGFRSDGIWKDGVFEGGFFYGKWYSGEWKRGEFSGKWLDPKNPKPLNIKEYRDGLTYEIIKEKFPWLLEESVWFNNAIIGYQGNTLIWYNGKWIEGTWENGIWKDGEIISKGIWRGGIFENGYFEGEWYGGKWKGGRFRGKWLDPNNPKPEKEDEI